MPVRGLGRADRPSRTKAPVSLEHLESFRPLLDLDRPLKLALQGVVALSIFFMLQRSEIVAEKSQFMWFVLCDQDGVVLDEQSRPTLPSSASRADLITIRGSKTDQVGNL